MNRLLPVVALLGCMSLAACADITLPSAPTPVTPAVTPAVDTVKTPTPPKATFTLLSTDFVDMDTYSYKQFAQNAFRACIPHGSTVQVKVVSENQTVVVALDWGWGQSFPPNECESGLDLVKVNMTLQALSEGSTTIDVLFNYTLPNTTTAINHNMSFQAYVSNKG